MGSCNWQTKNTDILTRVQLFSSTTVLHDLYRTEHRRYSQSVCTWWWPSLWFWEAGLDFQQTGCENVQCSRYWVSYWDFLMIGFDTFGYLSSLMFNCDTNYHSGLFLSFLSLVQPLWHEDRLDESLSSIRDIQCYTTILYIAWTPLSRHCQQHQNWH